MVRHEHCNVVYARYPYICLDNQSRFSQQYHTQTHKPWFSVFTYTQLVFLGAV